MNDKTTAFDSQAELTVPSVIYRWDLDKTYLRTEFDTFMSLVRTAFEDADRKSVV